MKSAMDRADRLSTRAMQAFHNAHAGLSEANAILAKEAEIRTAESEQAHREWEQYLKDCEEAQKVADAAHARNERRIAKIADFLEI